MDDEGMVLKRGFRWHTKQAFLEVSELSVVSLADDFAGNETQVTKFTFHDAVGATVGPYIQVSLGKGIKADVRWYWIPPSIDWRPDQSYFYKLSSAWITSNAQEWFYWNVNNQDDSELVIPSNHYHGIECEYMEFNFKDRTSGHKRAFKHEAQVQLYDVQMAFLPKGDTSGEKELKDVELYNPCQYRTCHAVDGKLSCGALRPWLFYTIVVGLAILVSCLGCVLAYFCNKGDPVKYKQVKLNEEDCNDEDDDDDDDEEGLGVETFRDEVEDDPDLENKGPGDQE